MHILLIHTGGTVGSISEKGIRNVNEKALDFLIDGYHQRFPNNNVTFTVRYVLNILSENLLPEDWQTLFSAIYKENLSLYDGIMITHGTDTLPFTSALAGYMLYDIGMPVAFIAGNDPPNHPQSNAYSNMACATLLFEKVKHGVFVPWTDKNNCKVIHLSTRLMPSNIVTDDFYSYGNKPFAKVQNDRLIITENEACFTKIYPKDKRQYGKEFNFTNRFLFIQPYPGLDYSQFTWQEENRPTAVLHALYHSSTANAMQSEYGLPSFIEKCQRENIPVYGFSFKMEKEQYATGSVLLEKGIIPLGIINPPAALAKLYFAFAQGEKGATQRIKENVFFEYITV